MPDFNEPEVQSAAMTFGLLCLVMSAILTFVSDDPAIALKAGGVLALVSTLVLVVRADPEHRPMRTLLPRRLHSSASQHRAGTDAHARAHLWFAQWTAILSIAGLAGALAL